MSDYACGHNLVTMNTNRKPRISETEWEVMRVVWGNDPITSNEVLTRLRKADPTWHPKTLRTLLARLVQKGALGYTAERREYRYRPLVSEREAIATASESFAERLFGGSLRPMLAHFVEQRRITREDLEELSLLLERSPKSKTEKPARRKP